MKVDELANGKKKESFCVVEGNSWTRCFVAISYWLIHFFNELRPTFANISHFRIGHNEIMLSLNILTFENWKIFRFIIFWHNPYYLIILAIHHNFLFVLNNRHNIYYPHFLLCCRLLSEHTLFWYNHVVQYVFSLNLHFLYCFKY